MPTENETKILKEASDLLGIESESLVIQILLKKGYESLIDNKKPKGFEESGFIGCGSSMSNDIAGKHKKQITKKINKKFV